MFYKKAHFNQNVRKISCDLMLKKAGITSNLGKKCLLNVKATVLHNDPNSAWTQAEWHKLAY